METKKSRWGGGGAQMAVSALEHLFFFFYKEKSSWWNKNLMYLFYQETHLWPPQMWFLSLSEEVWCKRARPWGTMATAAQGQCHDKLSTKLEKNTYSVFMLSTGSGRWSLLFRTLTDLIDIWPSLASLVTTDFTTPFPGSLVFPSFEQEKEDQSRPGMFSLPLQEREEKRPYEGGCWF